MNDQLKTSSLPNWLSTHNAISSPESESGALLCEKQAGPMTDPFGQEAARVNLSARLAKVLGLLTSGTFGLRSTTSSASAALQQSLANRLRAGTVLSGSTLYKLTWKDRALPSGRRICALRASALRTSDNASIGLPTPSGTSNHGKNHVAGRLDEWGGSSNPWRGTEVGKLHLPGFELWVMGLPAAWRELMPPATPSSRKSRKSS